MHKITMRSILILFFFRSHNHMWILPMWKIKPSSFCKGEVIQLCCSHRLSNKLLFCPPNSLKEMFCCMKPLHEIHVVALQHFIICIIKFPKQNKVKSAGPRQLVLCITGAIYLHRLYMTLSDKKLHNQKNGY